MRYDAKMSSLSVHRRARVRLAYLELMPPTLDAAVDALAAEGATSIRIVPVFFGQGGHVTADLPKLVARARARHPDVVIQLDAPVGEQPAVIEAIAAAIAR